MNYSGFTQEDSFPGSMECGGGAFHHRFKSSILNRTIDAGGMFSLAQDAVVTSGAGLQMPSASQARQQLWTATTV